MVQSILDHAIFFLNAAISTKFSSTFAQKLAEKKFNKKNLDFNMRPHKEISGKL